MLCVVPATSPTRHSPVMVRATVPISMVEVFSECLGDVDVTVSSAYFKQRNPSAS